MKDRYEKLSEIEAAVGEVRDLCHDMIFGRCFEGDYGSNLFTPDDERLAQVARRLEPALSKELEKSVTNAIEDDALLQDLIYHTRHAFLALGIFIGARIADPEGRSFDNFARGFVRASIAQPRHQHLRRRSATKRKAVGGEL